MALEQLDTMDAKGEEFIETQRIHSQDDILTEKRVVRKLDKWILSLLCPLSIFAILDRINIGNARIYGLEEELGLSSGEFSVAIAGFYIMYIIADIPSNLLIKKVGASNWLAFIAVSWGIVTTLTGLVQSFRALLACRLLLGLFEGGLTPGITLYLTFFYTRREIALRVSLFTIFGGVAGAFGGLIAYAIGKMDGAAGHKAWRWIFILEGIPSVIVGVVAWGMLADSPETARYLSPDERDLAATRQSRIASDGRDKSAEQLCKADIVEAVTDWKVWAFCVAEFGSSTMVQGFSVFLPSIIRAIHPEAATTQAQALTIPVWCVGVVSILIIAWISDRVQQRGSLVAGFLLFPIAGYAMLVCDVGSSAKYAACYMIILGFYVVLTLVFVWVPTNFPRYGKRAVSIAMVTMSNACGGIMMSFLYPKTEAPRFLRSHAITLGLVIWAALVFGALSCYFRYINQRRSAGKENYKMDGLSEEQIAELGDRSPIFMYTT